MTSHYVPFFNILPPLIKTTNYQGNHSFKTQTFSVK